MKWLCGVVIKCLCRAGHMGKLCKCELLLCAIGTLPSFWSLPGTDPGAQCAESWEPRHTCCCSPFLVGGFGLIPWASEPWRPSPG